MVSNIFSINIDKTENIPLIIGNISSFNVNIKNLSENQRLYNLGISFTLPDGITLSTSTIPQTSILTNPDNSTTYSWVNIKDLAPMEVNFSFSITVKCNSKFKNGSTIDFDYTFLGIIVSCYVDTMPRGSYDIENEVITESISMSYVTTRFDSTISTSGKILKGAGTSVFLNDYTQVTTATCKFYNNSVSASLVNITILLEDGVRYIGNITTSGTDASKFLSPNITQVKIDNKFYTKLYYGNINLSVSSTTILTFNFAVWNQYNNNEGAFIIHGTKIGMLIDMTSATPLITSTSNSSTKFSAMDLIINTSINKSTMDVQNIVTYTYVFKAGQYYNIKDLIVHYFLPDGIFYISSSTTPSLVVDNATLQGYYLTYNFALATQNSTKTITISARIDSYYRYKFDNNHLNLPIVAQDPFSASTDILGVLIGPLTNVTDSSSVASNIGTGTITKQFIKGYYKDGTPKSINALAPGDLAEYTLTYNASTLKAIQKQVYIDDFFPLSSNPINDLAYIYNGINPISAPTLISPHGVDFFYGDVQGLSSGTINFKVPITQLGSSTQNTNLMKLKGLNTYGYAYSNRAQVNINIGTPNLSLTKSVSGPNKNAIQCNEIYTYTVTISNSKNLGTETDAFDFTLTDSIATNWFIIDESSIKVSGSGNFNLPIIQNSSIVVYINKLSPGNSLTLTYKVTISPSLAPNISINTVANNTNPYSQAYNQSSTNFQYSNLNKSVSVTISSLGISIAKKI